MNGMDRETELVLVARLRAGDPDAFDAVHDGFNARLFNFLARLSRRRDVAEDLLEETWLRLVARAAHLQPDTRLGPWLFTVARSEVEPGASRAGRQPRRRRAGPGRTQGGAHVIAHDDVDPLLRDISQLTVLAPDARRSVQLRARCRARMRREPRPRRLLGPVVFAGLCVLYLTALVIDVLRLQGMP